MLAAIPLAACGGASDNKNTTDKDTPSTKVEQSFSAKAQWAITPKAGETTCFDFDSNKDVACEGGAWDMKLVMGSGSRATPQFYTNSGPLSAGKGGALGDTFNYSWEDLQKFPNATLDNKNQPILGPMFVMDSMNNGFSGSGTYGAFEYTNQKMLSKRSVYLITSKNTEPYSADSSDIYAVQLVDYYGGSTGSESGYPKLAYVKLSEMASADAVKEISINAKDGWAYLDLGTGTIVAKEAAWHLGFNRYNIVTNSGATGTGTVGSFEAQKVADFYDASGKVLVDKLSDATLIAATKNLLTSNSAWATPSAANKWQKDTLKSALNPAYKSVGEMAPPARMQLDYGFYSYYVGIDGHANHSFGANPERGVLLRSGEGSSYARVHLSSIVDGIYTFDFDVAPAAAK